MHLEAAQLVAAQNCCPVCGSESERRRAGQLQQEPEIHLLQCPDCHACSASHMPAQPVLDEYYGKYFRGDGPMITMPQIDGFVNRLLMNIGFAPSISRVRILDFGGGDGTLGLTLARRLLAEHPELNVSFTLVDYQTPASGNSDRLNVTHRRTLSEVEGPFDLVLASAVLEHIPDLQPVIENLFELLAPGGWFYARTPYVAPLKRVLPRFDVTYPGHVHDLGAPFWNRIAATYGQPLRVVVSRPSLVESDWLRQPVRTVIAWLLKLPARMELAVSSPGRTPWWRFVGGWEVVLQRL